MSRLARDQAVVGFRDALFACGPERLWLQSGLHRAGLSELDLVPGPAPSTRRDPGLLLSKVRLPTDYCVGPVGRWLTEDLAKARPLHIGTNRLDAPRFALQGCALVRAVAVRRSQWASRPQSACTGTGGPYANPSSLTDGLTR